ncbi:LLM class flavin-dependent oxidoreductase [Alphaproteobacteria bacterium]|nr:LLM class flavin-dependent oxidoreductase [Alphaproteobacteria bacterium]
MRFGTFLAPFHGTDENPTLGLERDFQLIEHLDLLGFDEAWIGEHHSGGMEIIASPEVFIAAAAERTQRIRLGTGVVTLPYHHPFMVAERINQLDHQTRGRLIFGVGAGALPYDAEMIGVDVSRIREMMDESLEVIIPLLHGETVTRKTDWFELREARLQVAAYTQPHVELAIPSVVSPSGPRTAGKYGMGLLSTAATTKAAFDALPNTWEIYKEQALDHDVTADRRNWRLVGPVHIAETRKAARENVKFGIQKWLHYFAYVGHLPLAATGEGDIDSDIDALIDAEIAVIGTPDDLERQIARLIVQSGGFGVFLDMAHNWADFEQTKRSYELIARYVAPRFKGTADRQEEAYRWAMNKKPELVERRQAGVDRAIQKHTAEREAKWDKSSGSAD